MSALFPNKSQSSFEDDLDTLVASARELLERSQVELSKFDYSQREEIERLRRSVDRVGSYDDALRIEDEMRLRHRNWQDARAPMVRLIEQIGKQIAEVTASPLVLLTPHQRPRA